MNERGLASRVPVPVLAVDADGTVRWANDAAVDYLGDHATPGACILNAVLDSDVAAMDALLACDDETERAVAFTVDGRTRRPTVVATPDDDGVELVVDTVAAAERYAHLVESVGDPMYVLDEDGYVETVNDALVETYGYEREEILGSHATEFMSEAAFERGTERIQALLAGDERTATFEFTATRGDGTEGRAEVNLGVLRDDDGAYVGTVGVIRDVSERKRREKELADFETIAEAAPVAMFTVDAEGTLTWGNWRLYERVGMSQDELVGRPFMDLVERGFVDFEMVEAYETYVPELLSSENERARVDHEEVLYPPDGERMYVDAHTTLLPLGEDGEFTGTVNAFRDITKRKTYREELERQNERLEAFASAVSHDLRNPLNVASGHLELSRARHPDDDALAEVSTSLSRMSELIEDILSLARQGESVTDTEPVDLALAARRAWGTVSTGTHALSVTADATIRGDESRLRQLFENCFRNSVEHGSTDARSATDSPAAPDAAGVSVRVGVLEDDADGFYVADDGPGLPGNVELFEPGATTNEEGTGLGLAIVAEIVHAHGWEISATTSEAGGARFEITDVEFVDSDAAPGDSDDGPEDDGDGGNEDDSTDGDDPAT